MPWLHLNALLGSLVVAFGLWLIGVELPLVLAVLLALIIAGFLLWQSPNIGTVWAWSTLLLGLESVAWPIVTMVQIRITGREPTEQQMGLMLTAILFGIFSGVFWLTFSYGIFKWTRKREAGAANSRRTHG
jgi:hypothetical protein